MQISRQSRLYLKARNENGFEECVRVKLLCSPKIIAHQQRQLFAYSSKKVQALQRIPGEPRIRPHCRMLQQLWNTKDHHLSDLIWSTAPISKFNKITNWQTVCNKCYFWITRWITYILQHMWGIIENRCKCSQTWVFLWHKSEYVDFTLCFTAVPPKCLR